MSDNLHTCCICLEVIGEYNNMITLSCNHILHKDCLNEYILNNFKQKESFNTCPLCRKFISTNIKKTYIYSSVNKINMGGWLFGVYIFFNIGKYFMNTQ
jgi:hypothetical protein